MLEPKALDHPGKSQEFRSLVSETRDKDQVAFYGITTLYSVTLLDLLIHSRIFSVGFMFSTYKNMSSLKNNSFIFSLSNWYLSFFSCAVMHST